MLMERFDRSMIVLASLLLPWFAPAALSRPVSAAPAGDVALGAGAHPPVGSKPFPPRARGEVTPGSASAARRRSHEAEAYRRWNRAICVSRSTWPPPCDWPTPGR